MADQFSTQLRALISRGNISGSGVVGETITSHKFDVDYFLKQIIYLPADGFWTFGVDNLGLTRGKIFDSVVTYTSSVYTNITTIATGSAGVFTALDAMGDSLYIGASQPFEIIYFDNSVPLNPIGSFSFTYSNSFVAGASWATLTPYFDGTAGLTIANGASIGFKAPYNWVKSHYRDGSSVVLPGLTSSTARYFVRIQRNDALVAIPTFNRISEGYRQQFIHLQSTESIQLEARMNYQGTTIVSDYIPFTSLSIKGGIHSGISVRNRSETSTNCYILIGY